MKPLIDQPMTAERYYYLKWKHHCFLFILALALMSNGIVWGTVAAFYGQPAICIGCLVFAVFFTFVAVIKHRDCSEAHLRYLRALCDGVNLNPNHTNQ